VLGREHPSPYVFATVHRGKPFRSGAAQAGPGSGAGNSAGLKWCSSSSVSEHGNKRGLPPGALLALLFKNFMQRFVDHTWHRQTTPGTAVSSTLHDVVPLPLSGGGPGWSMRTSLRPVRHGTHLRCRAERLRPHGDEELTGSGSDPGAAGAVGNPHRSEKLRDTLACICQGTFADALPKRAAYIVRGGGDQLGPATEMKPTSRDGAIGEIVHLPASTRPSRQRT